MLSLNELRRMVKKHNELMSIIIPPKTNREGLIKLIEKNGFTVDHDKKKIIPKVQMKRKPTVPLPPEPPKKTEEEKKVAKVKKMERESKRDKQGYEKELKKRVEAVKKARASKPPMKKENEVRPKQAPGRPRVDPKKIKVISKPEPKPAPKQRRKLKGRLTGARDKETVRIEKEIPEFYAPDKEQDNQANKIKEDIIVSYRRIKKSGDKELLKQARELLDKSKSRVRVDNDITFKNDLKDILKQMNNIKPGEKTKVEPGTAGVKVWTGSGNLPDGTNTKTYSVYDKAWRDKGFKITNLKPDKPKPKPEEKKPQEKSQPKKTGDRFKDFVIPELSKEVAPIFQAWLKREAPLYNKITSLAKWKVLPVKDEETGTIIKKGKLNPKPEWVKEKEKLLKEAKSKFREVYKRNNYAVGGKGFTQNFDTYKDAILRGFGSDKFGVKPNKQLEKKMKDRRLKEIQEKKDRKKK